MNAETVARLRNAASEGLSEGGALDLNQSKLSQTLKSIETSLATIRDRTQENQEMGHHHAETTVEYANRWDQDQKEKAEWEGRLKYLEKMLERHDTKEVRSKNVEEQINDDGYVEVQTPEPTETRPKKITKRLNHVQMITAMRAKLAKPETPKDSLDPVESIRTEIAELKLKLEKNEASIKAVESYFSQNKHVTHAYNKKAQKIVTFYDTIHHQCKTLIKILDGPAAMPDTTGVDRETRDGARIRELMRKSNISDIRITDITSETVAEKGGETGERGGSRGGRGGRGGRRGTPKF